MKKEFKELIKSDDLKNVTIDLFESVIDNSIKDEILKEVPILKTLVAAKNIYTSISDHFFIKKAMFVLLELGEVDWKQRTELLRELEEDNLSGSEKILMEIDKLGSIEKCRIFGRLCKLRALNKIKKYDYFLITKLIQDAFIAELGKIKEFEEDKMKDIAPEDYYHLISLGVLVPVQISRMSGGTKLTALYRLSYIGKVLFKYYHEIIKE